MENILMDGHCLSPYTCKCYTVFKQLNGLNFDGLAGKRQKRQIPTVKIFHYTVANTGVLIQELKSTDY